LTFTAIDRGITFRGQLQGLPLPQLCATGNAQTRRAGNRRARREIDVLNLPVSVVITECESMERLDQAIEAARTFGPLDKARISAVLTKTRSAALTVKYEPFKTTAKFDGTANSPHWMS
jgi:hypothetical protein